MHTKSNITSSFLAIYILSTSFFINRILTRNVFENTGKLGWLIILGTGIIISILLPIIYKAITHIQKRKNTKKLSTTTKLFTYSYLIFSSVICLLFLSTLMNAYWLKETRYMFLLIPFLLIIYYITKQPQDVYFRLITLFSYPILIQYLIFVFAKNKSFDLYALIPFQPTINNLWIVIITIIHMISQMFTIIFYISNNTELLNKKLFYLSGLFIIISLCFDSIIVTGQFGTSLPYFPFLYYESWRLLTFGQYIGYLDILSFFYWITSSICFVGLNTYLIKQNFSDKHYKQSYILLLVLTMFILTNGRYYHLIKPLLLILSTLCLLMSLIFFYKERCKNED